jgi:hypothetical protein
MRPCSWRHYSMSVSHPGIHPYTSSTTHPPHKVVDIAIEITQAFESEILKMEAGCLVNPQMESVRHLHIISSQLTRLKRTLSPLSHVLYTLRDRDSQRALVSALYGTTHGEANDHHTSSVLGYDSTHSTGYISQTTKVYLSDVIGTSSFGIWASSIDLHRSLYRSHGYHAYIFGSIPHDV